MAMSFHDIEKHIRAKSGWHNAASLNAWLNYSTLKRFQEWVPVPEAPGATLLDVGFYEPAVGYYAALGWQRVVGVAKEAGECSAENVAYKWDAARVEAVLIDIERDPLPVADGTIDVALMMEIFEHFSVDPMQALVEVNRALKLGGLLILSTPNGASFESARRLWEGNTAYAGLEFSGFSTNRHNRIYNAEELIAILGAAGFKIDVCQSKSYRPEGAMQSDPPYWTILKLLMHLTDLYLRWRTGRPIERHDYLFVRARKHGPVRDRYPRVLYFDREQWADWYSKNTTPAAALRL